MLKRVTIGCSHVGRPFQIPIASTWLNDAKMSPMGARFLGTHDRLQVFKDHTEQKQIEAMLSYRHAIESLLPPRTMNSDIPGGVQLLWKAVPQVRGATWMLAHLQQMGVKIEPQ